MLLAAALIAPMVKATTRTEPPQPPIVPPRGGPALTAAFSADGEWIVTGDYLGCARLWRVDRRTPVWSAWATEDPNQNKPITFVPVSAVGFAADGKRVFCAWYAGLTEIDRDKGKVLKRHSFPKASWAASHSVHWPDAIAILPGSDECVFHDVDERLVRFNFTTGKRHPKFDLRLSEVGPLCVILNPDGKRVLSHNGKQHLAEWDLETGEPCRLFGELPAEGTLTGYYPNGDRIWVCGSTLIALDRKTGKRTDLPEGLAKYKGKLWFSPDGKRAIGLPWYLKKSDRADGKEDRIDVLDTEDGKLLRSFSSEGVWYRQENLWRNPNDTTWTPTPGQLVFSPDGRSVLLIGGEDKIEMGVWDMTTGRRLRTFREE
jgi:WD40 repeat protein